MHSVKVPFEIYFILCDFSFWQVIIPIINYIRIFFLRKCMFAT